VEKANGVLIPGGFGDRGALGKVLAIKFARERKVPFLGICLGLQASAARERELRASCRSFACESTRRPPPVPDHPARSQMAVIEYARNVLDLQGANSAEFDAEAEHPVVMYMPEISKTHMGGTMRLGLRKCEVEKGERPRARKRWVARRSDS
jgi:CTP synthase